MPKVYLSPSQQEHNIGVGAYGTEAARCRIICRMAAELLRAAPSVTVRVAPDYTRLDEPADYLSAVRDSNRWGADVHVAVHTNAGGKGADGTDTFYLSAEGKKLAAALQRRVGAVSPGSDGGIHSQRGWAELDSTRAVAALIELAFHTDPKDALSIIAQPGLYAAALADGVCDYLGISLKPKYDPRLVDIRRRIIQVHKADPELAGVIAQYAPRWALKGR